MVQTPTTPITLEGFLKLPETKPASEYIDGKIIQKPMPPEKHSTVVSKNILHCLKQGTQMGWLIDPDELTIFVYSSQQEIQIFLENINY